MERLAQIEAKLASMGGLLDVVSAMRSLASMRLQETAHGLEAMRRYSEEIRAALAAAASLLPEPTPAGRTGRVQRAIVLCTAEHGFVGDFNRRLVQSAQAAATPEDHLFVLGSRGAATLAASSLRAAWTGAQATRASDAPQAALRLSEELFQRIVRGEVGRIELIYACYQPGHRSTILRRTVVPIEWDTLAAAPRQPLLNLSPRELIDELTSEYLYALLTDAVLESLASENAARFAAMESARDNISKKLEQLRQGARIARQDEITTELMDVVTGAQALME